MSGLPIDAPPDLASSNMSQDQVAADEALAKALQRQEAEEYDAILRQQATDRREALRGAESSDDSSWGAWLDRTANMAGDFAIKAADASIKAAFEAKEHAEILAKKAKAEAEKYDLDNVFAASLNADSDTPQGKPGTKVRRINHQMDFVYITENLVAMAFPVDPKKPTQGASGGNDIREVAAYLKEHHEGKFMVWNISEESYDASCFADQVLEYRFPGHPAPPLGLLFKICTSIESWLDADEDNIGIVHCLTGKGRTAALMACVLTWTGEFSSPVTALEYIADRKGIEVEALTIPSQRRYLSYFGNMLEGIKPRPEPLLLRRVIINTVPVFGDNSGGEANEGCCPYLQLFKGGRLISTSVPVDETNGAAGGEDGGSKVMLKWSKVSDGCVSFNVDCAVQGDILLRARHAAPTGQRISMFRAAFHTGYVPAGVLRLSKDWLDGAAGSSRFHDDFFIDLIFAPMGVQLPEDGENSNSGGDGDNNDKKEAAAGEVQAERLPPPPGKLGVVAAPSDSGLIIDASSADRYEKTLHMDSRFWETVEARKSKSKHRKSRKFRTHVRETFTLDDREDSCEEEDLSPVIKQRSATLDKQRETSDRDLIEALAQAELEDSGLARHREDDSSLGGAIVEAASQQPSSSSFSPQEGVAKELEELAALERELGLDSATQGNEGGRAGPGESGGVAGGEEDDLDDLEKYLNSIQ